jgi:hypothetical protein
MIKKYENKQEYFLDVMGTFGIPNTFLVAKWRKILIGTQR